MRNFILFTFLLFISEISFAQPANDDPCSATPLAVNTSCTYTSGTNVGATASAGPPAPTCASYSGGDVWFTIVVPAGGTITVLGDDNGGFTDGGLAIYSGTCGSLTQINCNDDGGPGLHGQLTLTGQTPGATLWVRYWEYGNNTFGTFNICASEPPAPPANDDCAGAFPVTVNPDFNCGSTTAGTIQSATASSQAAGTCGGTEDDDVWFSFVATGTSHTVDILNTAGSTTDMYHSVWTGTCPGLTFVAGSCSDADNQTLTGLTAGNTYFIRVYTWTGTAGQTSTFDVCVGTPPPPPANDDCTGAFPVTVNPDYNCANTTAGTVAGSTASSQSAGTCGGTEDDDVWFSFVATGTSHSIDILNTTGSTTDMYHSVWTGACPGLTFVAGSCSDADNQSLTGLTAGNTYYIRVYTWTGTAGQTSSFDVCVGTPPPPPANDDCTGAFPVTVNPDYSCGSTTAGTVAGATASIQSAGTCAGTENDDVWFTFVATGTTHTIDILNASGSTTDMYHSVWEGICPALTFYAGTCSDPNNQTVSGLTPGNTYYIRVYSYTSTAGQTTSFDVCVGTPPPPPPNDDCAGAISLIVNPDLTCTNTTSGSVGGATASTQDPSACGGTENDDVWYSFDATGTSHSINILNTIGSTTDMYHSVWEGTCPGLTLFPGSCSDGDSQTLTGLTIGQTYYVRVNTWSSTAGATSSFDLCITTPVPPPPCDPTQPPPNDDCSAATSINTFDGYCGTTLSTYTVDANAAFCGSMDNNSWLQFVAGETSVSITWWITGGASCTSGVQFEAYSGTCGSLTALSGSCVNPTGSSGANGTFSFSGLTIGNTYYLMIDGYAGDVCDYTWQAQSGILPVELMSFNGIAAIDRNDLTWETKSEINNDYFVIEKSLDGVNFTSIGKVQGNGNSTSAITYDFSDYQINTESISYYRIKQVDFNGKATYSFTIPVEREQDKFTIYPNPSEKDLTFKFNDLRTGLYEITYTNTIGQIITETITIENESGEIKSISFEKLSTGMYFVIIRNESGLIIHQEKIVKK